MAHLDCNEVVGHLSLCSLRENHTLLYFLTFGEPIVDIDSNTRANDYVIVLSVLFLGMLLLLGLSTMAMLVLAGSKSDYEELGLRSFWEPKLTYVIFASGLASSTSRPSSNLETAWIVTTNILLGRDGTKGSYWYACFSQKPAIMKGCYWLTAATLVPLWLATGLLTFGVLWPPQIRRYLFRPQMGESFRPHRSKTSATEVYASQVSGLRRELGKIRDMSYERSMDIQRDLRELKEYLHYATTD